jgi:hypothetical protein
MSLLEKLLGSLPPEIMEQAFKGAEEVRSGMNNIDGRLSEMDAALDLRLRKIEEMIIQLNSNLLKAHKLQFDLLNLLTDTSKGLIKPDEKENDATTISKGSKNDKAA